MAAMTSRARHLYSFCQITQKTIDYQEHLPEYKY